MGFLKVKKYLRIEKALQDDKVYELFLRNVRASGYADMIQPLRGQSDEILPSLESSEFNLVYIDGNHSYSQVIRDLRNSERLLKDNGILCGDDLELQRNQIDIQYAEKHRERDAIVNVKNNKSFHPGVTLAVWEFFGGDVSHWDGFYAMRKTKSGWQKVGPYL